MRHVLLHFIQLDQDIHRKHALTEIAFVEIALEHELVKMLQLREREFLRQESNPIG